MKKTFIHSVIVFLVCLPIILPAQMNCADFFRYQTSGAVVYPWKRDNQSKVGFFDLGQASTLKVVMYEGKDYKIRFFPSNPGDQITYKVTVNGQQVYSVDPSEGNAAAKIIAGKQSVLDKLTATLTSLTGKKLDAAKAQVDAMKAELTKLQNDFDQKYQSSSDEGGPAPCTLSVTSTTNCEINITLLKNDNNAACCVGVLIMNTPTQKSGF